MQMEKRKKYCAPFTESVGGYDVDCYLFMAESDIRHSREMISDITVDAYEEDETVNLTMYIEFTSPWEDDEDDG